MTNEQRKAIELAKEFTKMDFSNPMGWTGYYDTELEELSQAIDTVLSLIKEQQEREKLIKEYVHQEIVSYTETIRDYIDDDKEGNKDYIGQLKEERKHWKDIEKILQNKPKEELYMNWWRYGLYE